MITTPSVPLHRPAELVELAAFEPAPRKLSVASFGDGGCGKTRFILTAPGPVGVIPLNRKCRPTLEAFHDQVAPGKRLFFPKVDLIRHANPMRLAMMEPFCDNKLVKIGGIGSEPPQCCAKHFYRWSMNRIKDAIWTMAENTDIRTIAIDDCTALYEDVLYAHYGRANRISDDKTVYGPPNQEVIDLINSIDHKHIILVHQAKEEYKGKNPTGRDTVKGFREVGYYVSVLAEFAREDKKPEFFLNVRMCQENAGLHGDAGQKLLKNDDITFTELAARVFGESVDLTEYM